MRRNIAEMIRLIYQQDIVPSWLLANDNVLFSASQKKKYPWQKKSKMIYYAMKFSRVVYLSDFAIFVIGCFWISKALLTIRKNKKVSVSHNDYQKIFVCHGAHAEDFIFSDYCSRQNESIHKINVITLEGLEALTTPSILLLFRYLFHHAFGVSRKIKKLSQTLHFHCDDFLTCSAKNIGEYVFFSIIWRLAKAQGVNEVIFLALHVAAHACPPEKMQFQYLSHGLMKLSILPVKPNYSFMLTPEENAYFRSFFCHNVNCDLYPQYQLIDEGKNQEVLILSPEIIGVDADDIEKKFQDLLTWLSIKNFKITLRPSPGCKQSVIAFLKNKFPISFHWDIPTRDLFLSLKTIKPKFIIGLNSTGLYTALCMGVLPISLCDPDPNHAVWNMVYPMRKRVLFWPRDQALLDSIMHSSALYDQSLHELCTACDDELC